MRYLSLIALLMGTPAHAGTILSTDAFGECITEEELDNGAFGKMTKLPRTCIPDPCAVIPIEEYHYAIVGRPVTPMQYDAFLRKQDKACPIEEPRAEFTDEDLLRWAFNGSTIPRVPETPAPVPLPAGAWLLLTGIALLASRKYFGHRA